MAQGHRKEPPQLAVIGTFAPLLPVFRSEPMLKGLTFMPSMDLARAQNRQGHQSLKEKKTAGESNPTCQAKVSFPGDSVLIPGNFGLGQGHGWLAYRYGGSGFFVNLSPEYWFRSGSLRTTATNGLP